MGGKNTHIFPPDPSEMGGKYHPNFHFPPKINGGKKNTPGHTLTGTLTKKISHEIRGPKKSMQKLGLAVDTGIGRDPFSDPVLSHFLHFF